MARLLFFALAFVILFAGFTLIRTSASETQIRPESPSETIIFADTGDTLWDLASAVKKPSIDTREAVHQLMKRNHLDSSALESGQRLIVPESILP